MPASVEVVVGIVVELVVVAADVVEVVSAPEPPQPPMSRRVSQGTRDRRAVLFMMPNYDQTGST